MKTKALNDLSLNMKIKLTGDNRWWFLWPWIFMILSVKRAF